MMPMKSEPAPRAGENRQERRRRETRTRLVQAAFAIFAEKGVASTSVADITEQADVGLGSFYNYFTTKEDAFQACFEDGVESFARALDGALGALPDPAERVAAASRLILTRAAEDETWGRFFIQAAVRPEYAAAGFGRRLMRDVVAGIEGGRFRVSNPIAATVAASGVIAGAIMAFTSKVLDAGAIQDCAAIVLGTLGVEPEEARRVAARRLPPLGPASAAA